jgi:hypothetical protein
MDCEGANRIRSSIFDPALLTTDYADFSDCFLLPFGTILGETSFQNLFKIRVLRVLRVLCVICVICGSISEYGFNAADHI